MAGRTWLQQATPITFGLKAAGWLRRARSRRRHGSRRRSTTALGPAVRRRVGHARRARRSRAGRRRSALGARARAAGAGDAVARPPRSSRVARVRARRRDRDRRKDRARSGLLAQTGDRRGARAAGDGGRLVDHAAQAESGARRDRRRRGRARARARRHDARARCCRSTSAALGGWQAEWDTMPELVDRRRRCRRARWPRRSRRLVVDPGANAREPRDDRRARAGRSGGDAPGAGDRQAGGARASSSAPRAGPWKKQRAFADVLADDPAVTAMLDRSEIDASAVDPRAISGRRRRSSASVLARHGRGRRRMPHVRPRRMPLELRRRGRSAMARRCCSRTRWARRANSGNRSRLRSRPCFRMIRYDTRGHGASDAPQGPYTIEMLGLDALAVLDAAGVDRAHVCGLSLGGLTAMWLAVQQPGPRRNRSCLRARRRASATRRCGTSGSHRCRHRDVDSLADAAIGRWFTETFRRLTRTSSRSTGACCRRRRRAGMPRPVPPFATPTCDREIGAITAPALVIAGHHDPVTPPADADDIRARIPAARVALLDGAHIINVEQAEAFNAQLSAFITDRGPGMDERERHDGGHDDPAAGARRRARRSRRRSDDAAHRGISGPDHALRVGRDLDAARPRRTHPAHPRPRHARSRSAASTSSACTPAPRSTREDSPETT